MINCHVAWTIFIDFLNGFQVRPFWCRQPFSRPSQSFLICHHVRISLIVFSLLLCQHFRSQKQSSLSCIFFLAFLVPLIIVVVIFFSVASVFSHNLSFLFSHVYRTMNMVSSFIFRETRTVELCPRRGATICRSLQIFTVKICKLFKPDN